MRKNDARFVCVLKSLVSHTASIGELKQLRRRRIQKRHLKKWIRAASNFIALVPSRLIRQMLAFFLEVNFKGLYQSSRKEKDSCRLVFPFSKKREMRHFNVVSVQRRLRNVQKSVMNVQSCCFANLNLLLFCLVSQRSSPLHKMLRDDRKKKWLSRRL